MLLANNTLIIWQFANGYVLKDSTEKWDERMRILINVSSCGTLIGQAWTKTAFGVTLLRMTNKWQQYVLWFCIVSMNLFMVLKVIFQWAQICDKEGYAQSWRLSFCINWTFRENFKEGGNGRLYHSTIAMLLLMTGVKCTTLSWTSSLQPFLG